MARERGARFAPRAEAPRHQAGGLQRGDQERGPRCVHPPSRDRPRAGRGLPRPPGARLPRRLHTVAGVVAQASGQPLGGPRPVRRAAPDLRAGIRDRGVQVPRILDHRGRVQDRSRPDLYRAADPPRRQAPRALRSRHRGQGAGRRRRDPARIGFYRRRDRQPAGPPQPVPALYDLDLAAGGVAQTRAVGQPHDANRAAALRGHRARRRDGRIDHIYADGWRRDFGRGNRRGPPADRGRVRITLPAGRAAGLPQPR